MEFPNLKTVNAVGLDLYRRLTTPEPNGNFLLSPYSIVAALAMTYAGAEHETRQEMQRVLHFPEVDEQFHNAMCSFARDLEMLSERSQARTKEVAQYGGSLEPTELSVANRIFAQGGYQFRARFLALLAQRYFAPLELLNFCDHPEEARATINSWVADSTHNRINDLIPRGGISSITRLVLTNALHIRAPWADPFDSDLTQPEAFCIEGRQQAAVPTMTQTGSYRCEADSEATTLEIPFASRELSLVIWLPHRPDGVSDLSVCQSESALTGSIKNLATRIPLGTTLHLPKFRMERPSISLRDEFVSLGMGTTFDCPQGSANFDRMAPRHAEDYLYIGDIFHQTFLDLNEGGVEATAATAVVVAAGCAAPAEPPKEIHVDRPFLFAVVHRPSAACLFLDRVTDPR